MIKLLAAAGPRPFVTTAAGRCFHGRLPGDVDGADGEASYIKALAESVDGLVEVRLPVGQADVATNETVFEVEPASQWRTGVRQAYGYAGMSGLAPAVALFGKADYRSIAAQIERTMPGLALWVWADDQWWNHDQDDVARRRWWESVEGRRSPMARYLDSVLKDVDWGDPCSVEELGINPRLLVAQ